ncbi:hypothetical protein JTE90_018851 [Oedothorax gibbosus]|uniref:Uncharacterized protein n=1 Tax=Oedothorax gibbosus TaxID=931172 RepID=A0AAV6UY37_9ARAC|nr:hypothetical protein JTE90_018851 [Oedothorax gibbosus]
MLTKVLLIRLSLQWVEYGKEKTLLQQSFRNNTDITIPKCDYSHPYEMKGAGGRSLPNHRLVIDACHISVTSPSAPPSDASATHWPRAPRGYYQRRVFARWKKRGTVMFVDGSWLCCI